MDFIKKFKSAFSRPASAASSVDIAAPVAPAPYDSVRAFERDALSAPDNAVLDLLPAAQAIYARPPADWPECAVTIVQRLKEIDDGRTDAGLAYYHDELWRRVRCLNHLMNRLLVRQPPFSAERLAALLDLCAQNAALFRENFPFDLLVQQIKPLAVHSSSQGILARAVADFAAA